MVFCSAYGCNSRSDRKEEGITFHRLPFKDQQRLNLWIKHMKFSNGTPTPYHRLCSKHFEKNLFYESGTKTYLKDYAVPTIFLELPKKLQRNRKRSANEIKQKKSVKPIASTSNLEELRKQFFQGKVRNKSLPVRKRLKKTAVPTLQLPDIMEPMTDEELFDRKMTFVKPSNKTVQEVILLTNMVKNNDFLTLVGDHSYPKTFQPEFSLKITYDLQAKLNALEKDFANYKKLTQHKIKLLNENLKYYKAKCSKTSKKCGFK